MIVCCVCVGSTKVSKDSIPDTKFAGNFMAKFRVEAPKPTPPPVVPGYYVVTVKVISVQHQ